MKITIDKPCSEKWDEMQDDISGKFCLKCKETVIDFTDSSSEEIMKELSGNQKICGRFTSAQLDDNYGKSWVKILMTALITSGAITFADAQKVDSLFHKSDNKEISSAIEGLSKKVPGLMINKAKSESEGTYNIQLGRPRYRATGAPLIVIDGVESTVEIFRQIPSDKIETVTTLLPFQAMALYKSKGRNGAIFITTKKEKSSVLYL